MGKTVQYGPYLQAKPLGNWVEPGNPLERALWRRPPGGSTAGATRCIMCFLMRRYVGGSGHCARKKGPHAATSCLVGPRVLRSMLADSMGPRLPGAWCVCARAHVCACVRVCVRVRSSASLPETKGFGGGETASGMSDTICGRAIQRRGVRGGRATASAGNEAPQPATAGADRQRQPPS